MRNGISLVGDGLGAVAPSPPTGWLRPFLHVRQAETSTIIWSIRAGPGAGQGMPFVSTMPPRAAQKGGGSRRRNRHRGWRPWWAFRGGSGVVTGRLARLHLLDHADDGLGLHHRARDADGLHRWGRSRREDVPGRAMQWSAGQSGGPVEVEHHPAGVAVDDSRLKPGLGKGP